MHSSLSLYNGVSEYILNAIKHKVDRSYILNSKNHGTKCAKSPNDINILHLLFAYLFALYIK